MKRSGVCAAGILVTVVAAALVAGPAATRAQDAAGASYTPVAISGTTAAGTGSELFGTFAPPSINATGNLVFVGTLSTASSGTQTGIWLGRADELSLIAREGSAAPGQPSNTLFGSLSASSPAQNAASDIVFNGRLKFTDSSSTFDSLWLATPGNPPSMFLRGGTLAPGTTANFIGIAGAVLQGDPITAVHASLDDTGDGLWEGPVSSIGLVVRAGEPAPGVDDGAIFDGSFTNTPALSSSGQLAFSAALSTPGGSHFDRGIWVGSGGSLSLVARFGRPAPGTTSTYFSFIGDPQLNNAGTIAFSTGLAGGTRAIYVGTAGNLSLVVRTGEPAPGAGADILSNLEGPILGGGGHIAFAGTINGFSDTGIWSGRPDSISLVARTGQIAPGTGGASFGFLSTPVLNGNGQTAFRSTLNGGAGSAGLFAVDPFGDVVNVVSVGNTLPISPTQARTVNGFSFATTSGGEDGRPSSFNDSSQLAFAATFSDGSRGVYIARAGGAARLTLKAPIYGPAANYRAGATLIVPGDGTAAVVNAQADTGFVSFITPGYHGGDVLVYLKVIGTSSGVAAAGRELTTSAAAYGYSVSVNPPAPPGDFNVLLTFARASTGNSPQKFYWNLTNIEGATVAEIGVVPEPTSVSMITISGAWGLLGRAGISRTWSKSRRTRSKCR